MDGHNDDHSLQETMFKIRAVLRLIRTSKLNNPGADMDTFFLIYELERLLASLKNKNDNKLY